MDLSDRERLIVKSAAEHEWRYYLPRRWRRSPLSEKSETDLNYDACDALVFKGLAQHLGESGPGIWVKPIAHELLLDYSD